MDRMRRPAVTGILIAAATLVLAGCFSIETRFDISDDGTVDIGFETRIDTEQLSELAGMFGQDSSELDGLSPTEIMSEFMDGEDPCSDMTSSFSGYEATTNEIDEGSIVGVGCTIQDVPLTDINDLGDDSTLSIDQDEDGTSFRLEMEGVDQLAGEDTEMFEMMDLNIDELIEIRFVVSAPGSLDDNNASETDGSEAIWMVTGDASFVEGGDATMTAEWSNDGGGSSSSSLWIILAIIAGLIVIALVVFLIMRSRSSDSDGPTGEGTAPPAPPTPGAPTATEPFATPTTNPPGTVPPTPPTPGATPEPGGGFGPPQAPPPPPPPPTN